LAGKATAKEWRRRDSVYVHQSGGGKIPAPEAKKKEKKRKEARRGEKEGLRCGKERRKPKNFSRRYCLSLKKKPRPRPHNVLLKGGLKAAVLKGERIIFRGKSWP